MTTFETFISHEYAYQHADGVPLVTYLTGDEQQGDRLPSGQHLFQFYTGNGFERYVILLDWEQWEGERCPRFAVYKLRCFDKRGTRYELAQDVSEDFKLPF